MFKTMFRAFRRPTIEPVSCPVDTVRLDESLHLLRTTTIELSEAAVSAAKALEDQLHDSEFRFISTIDSITDIVVIKDGAGRWKTLNKLGQDVFGWSHGEFYDKTDEQLGEEFPHLKETMAICTKTDAVAWETKKSYRTEERVPDGVDEYVFDVVKTPRFNTDGSRKELIVIGRDVTEIREKQRRTKACFHALNSASDMIAIIDTNCRIFFCNDRFVEQLHIVDYNECVGERLDDVTPAITEFDVMWETVQKNQAWEGSCGKYKLNVLPMMNGAPKPIYYVCTFKAKTKA